MGEEEVHVVLYGKRVNLTHWAISHPGGKEVLKAFKDRDATDQFEAMHSPAAKAQLSSIFLPKSPPVSSPSLSPSPSSSSLSPSSPSPSSPSSSPYPSSSSQSPSLTSVTLPSTPKSLWAAPSSALEDSDAPKSDQILSKEYTQLRKTLEEKGYFKTNVLKELLLVTYTLSMYAIGSYLIFSTIHHYVGLFMLLLGLHQSGWVAHDFLHHAIFKSVYTNEICGDFFGILQGYDKGWWKSRHNAHHVNTNECLHDPDISIAPLFHFVQQYPDLLTRLKHIQKYQKYYFLPFLTLLDIDWRVESILHIKNNYHKSKLPAFKMVCHYIVAGMVFCAVGGWPFFSLVLARGFFTAMIVFSNHYTEKRFCSNPSLSLVEQTAYTTRNITGGALINFFSGHISMQIEHHLFPTMPPHNLRKIQPYVRQFFKDHNLPYHESSLADCIYRLLCSLDIHSRYKYLHKLGLSFK